MVNTLLFLRPHYIMRGIFGSMVMVSAFIQAYNIWRTVTGPSSDSIRDQIRRLSKRADVSEGRTRCSIRRGTHPRHPPSPRVHGQTAGTFSVDGPAMCTIGALLVFFSVAVVTVVILPTVTMNPPLRKLGANNQRCQAWPGHLSGQRVRVLP